MTRRQAEALELTGSWKVPILLIYERLDLATIVPVPPSVGHLHVRETREENTSRLFEDGPHTPAPCATRGFWPPRHTPQPLCPVP